jgi:hypothetical protein
MLKDGSRVIRGSDIPPREPPFDQEDLIMAKYGAKSKSEVGKALHRKKKGTLKSGKSRKSVKSRKQAIAIGLSKARKKGAKVPKKK